MKVTQNGSIRWKTYYWIYLTASLKGKYVGVLEMGNGIWRVFYRNVFLGFFDEQKFKEMKQAKINIKLKCMKRRINLNINKIKTIIMKKSIFAVLILFTIQLQAQEINTKQDAIKFFDETFNGYHGGYITETTIRLDGTVVTNIRGIIGYYIENEYLILHTQESSKEYLINLTDSFTLNKKTVDKYEKLFVRSRNFILSMGACDDVYKKSSKKYLDIDNEDTKKLFQAINVLKVNFDQNEKAELKAENFKKEYLSFGLHQEMTEEQRKYVVQANVANDAKDYINALLLYRKCLDVNRISYPAAYFNMALILAELKHYYQATYAMKSYLILAPNADDSRKAQDKIYEWELNIKN